MKKILNTSERNFKKSFELLLKRKKFDVEKIDKIVKVIINDVKTRSDQAIIEYTKKFDDYNVKNFSDLVVSQKEIDDSFKKLSPIVLKAIRKASNRIQKYHARQKPKDDFYKDKEGVYLGSQWKPIESVGLYVPGGTASYPSSVLMNAIPAIVAGVKRIVMVVPTPSGDINPTIFAVAKILKINEIYKIGGAQAIAALSYGTKSIKKVDKICGPGNAFVASAKKQVYGIVGIDMIAGPSEILVVADRFNNAKNIAIDLLSQAEHDQLAQAILITDSKTLAFNVLKNIEEELQILPRKHIASKSWNNFGSIILVEKINDAVNLINEISPEHLELSVKDSYKFSKKINNAGAIFLGKYTPEAIGDYIAGPNHVLPTGRTSRFSSGLNVLDYMKRTSLVKCDKRSLSKIGPEAVIIAREEGLDAHAKSIIVRINKE